MFWWSQVVLQFASNSDDFNGLKFKTPTVLYKHGKFRSNHLFPTFYPVNLDSRKLNSLLKDAFVFLISVLYTKQLVPNSMENCPS
jgi:hypothetical protein